MDRNDYDLGDRWYSHYEESVSVPGFHRLQKLRAPLPENPYYWRATRGESPYSFTYNGWRNERQARGYATYVDACLAGYLDNQIGNRFSCTSLREIEDYVGNRLLSKVRNQEINLGTTFGEIGETIDMVSSSARTLARAYSAARRGNVAGVVRAYTGSSAESRVMDVAKAGANANLAFNFGVRPLVDDVYGLYDQMVLKNSPQYRDVHVVKASRFMPCEAQGFSSNGFHFNSIKGTITVKGSVTFWVTNPLLKTLDSLGLLNPIAVAWELVPYSFVVDWFLPIGAALESIVPPQGVQFTKGWISSRIEGVSYSETKIPPSGGSIYGWNTSAIAREVEKRRKPFSDLPRYHVSPPNWDLKKEQMRSGLALMVQKLR